jgi:alpha/beta superfamily hydrolase
LPRAIESHFLPGPAGRLEALLEEPEHDDPTFAALVCHPHPQHGGTMHNKVVYRIARGLRASGGVALRFNYRGVNLSDGVYDHGIGEIKDAQACLGWLRARYPEIPLIVAGFSFGARIAHKLACPDAGVRLALLVGFPTRYLLEERFEDCAIPRWFIQSTHDAHGPRSQLEPFVSRLGEAARITWIEARDHFFGGALDVFEELVRGAVQARDKGQ